MLKLTSGLCFTSCFSDRKQNCNEVDMLCESLWLLSDEERSKNIPNSNKFSQHCLYIAASIIFKISGKDTL